MILLIKVKLYLLIIAFLLASCVESISQNSINNDTIFIYDTEIIYDTVFVYDTVKVPKVERADALDQLEIKTDFVSLLHVDTNSNKASLLLISENYSATIPINGIILNEYLKNLESMKKLNFLGVLLFATQSMVFSQIDYGITFGGGSWWATTNEPYPMYSVSDIEYKYTYNVGFFIKKYFSKNLYLETELKYLFNKENNSYRVNYNGVDLIFEEDLNKSKLRPIVYTDIYGGGFSSMNKEGSSSLVGNPESFLNFRHIAIPFNAGLTLSKFSTYLGFEYAYRIPKLTSHAEVGTLFGSDYENTNGDSYFKNSHTWGLITGVKYVFFKKLNLGIKYYHGLTKDFEYTGHTLDFDVFNTTISNIEQIRENTLRTDKYRWKNHRIEFSISYSLKMNKQKEELQVPH